MAELRLQRVAGKERYRLDRKITLGRHPDNDIVVSAEGVSRHHCQINIDARGHIVVEDLGSANGTFVNDEKVERIRIKENDVLQIGAEKFTFVPAGQKKVKKEVGKPVSKYTSLLQELGGVKLTPLGEGVNKYTLPVDSIYTIGRLKYSHVNLKHGSISRTHAKIDVRKTAVKISDQKSANGTFINDVEVKQEEELKQGDTVRFAQDFQFKVDFVLEQKNSFLSLKAHDSIYTVDVLPDQNKLLEVFQYDVGDQVLSEIKRQTLLFCEDFDERLAAQPSGELLTRLLSILSKAEYALDRETLRSFIAEGKPLDESFDVDFLQRIDELATNYAQQHVVYFEDMYPEYPTIVRCNGLLINLSSGLQNLVFGIPYENVLYLIYASNWLSQLQVPTS